MMGLSAFVSAAEQAGIRDQLESGTFTLLAPSNAALGGATLPADPDLLANILWSHILPYRADEATLLSSGSVRSSANRKLSVDKSNRSVGGVGLGSDTDGIASNGVVHVLEGVLAVPSAGAFLGADIRTSALASAVGQASASVGQILEEQGPITIFAPKNAAFDEVDLEVILADATYLDLVLGFHVVSGHMSKADLVALGDDESIETRAGQHVGVRLRAGGEVVLADSQDRTARIETPDIRVSNAIIHIVDTLLLPDRGEVDALDTLRRNNFATFAQTVETSGLQAEFQADRPLTVFAPTDAAFAAAQADLPNDPDLLANVLLSHTATPTLSTVNLRQMASVRSVGGARFLLGFDTEPPTIGPATFTRAVDIRASNGIVHGIDRVLFPPRIDQAVARNADLTVLEAAVAAADPGIQALLAGDEPVTLFAPSDAAFEGVDVEELLADPTRLNDLLGFHVVQGQVLSSDLTDGQVLAMANGATVTVRITNGVVRLDDGVGTPVRIGQPNLRFLNGAVHILEGVLRPNHLEEIVRATGLQSFLELLRDTGLNDQLLVGGPLTVFGPTDAALADVDLDGLNPFVVETILLSHLVDGAFSSAQIAMATDLPALTKLDLEVGSSTTTGLSVGGAAIGDVVDVQASNGVVHTLDGIIVPPALLDVLATMPETSSTAAAIQRAPAVLAAVQPDVGDGATPVVFLVPTNQAWIDAGIDVDTVDAAALERQLSHHVIPLALATTKLGATTRVPSLEQNLVIRINSSGIRVEDASLNVATVLEPDIRALDGSIWIIDRVLTPR